MELPSALSGLSCPNISLKNVSQFLLQKPGSEKISDNFSKKYFLLFCEMELSYIFSKESFSYISGSGNPEKLFAFRKWNFPSSKKKKKKKKNNNNNKKKNPPPKNFFRKSFRKQNFKAPWLKSFLYFLKCNFLIFSYISGNVTF